MFFNNTLNDGKSYAGPLKVFGAMETLEHAEQLACILFVEASAIIPNEDHRHALVLDLADFDDSDFAFAGIFDGIRNQIREHLFHQTGITFY